MRKDRYVVGYKGARNMVYGKKYFQKGRKMNMLDADGFASPMTELQAKRGLKEMPCKGAVIFKLVPVDL